MTKTLTGCKGFGTSRVSGEQGGFPPASRLRERGREVLGLMCVCGFTNYESQNPPNGYVYSQKGKWAEPSMGCPMIRA